MALAIGFGLGIGFILVAALYGDSGSGATLLLAVGVAVAMIVALVLTIRFLYVVPAIMRTDLTFRESVRASLRASGHRLRAGLAIAMVSGLAAAPAAAIEGIILVPGEDASSNESALILLAALAIGWLLQMITMPLRPLAATVAYRRLRIPNPAALPVPPSTPRRAAVGRVAVAALTVIWLVGNTVSSNQRRQAAALPTADRGTITFGFRVPADALHCAAREPQGSFTAGSGPLAWAAFLSAPLKSGSVELAVSSNGAELGRVPLDGMRAGLICIWGEERLEDWPAGSYQFDLYADGAKRATGTLRVAGAAVSPRPTGAPSSPTPTRPAAAATPRPTAVPTPAPAGPGGGLLVAVGASLPTGDACRPGAAGLDIPRGQPAWWTVEDRDGAIRDGTELVLYRGELEVFADLAHFRREGTCLIATVPITNLLTGDYSIGLYQGGGWTATGSFRISRGTGSAPAPTAGAGQLTFGAGEPPAGSCTPATEGDRFGLDVTAVWWTMGLSTGVPDGEVEIQFAVDGTEQFRGAVAVERSAGCIAGAAPVSTFLSGVYTVQVRVGGAPVAVGEFLRTRVDPPAPAEPSPSAAPSGVPSQG